MDLSSCKIKANFAQLQDYHPSIQLNNGSSDRILHILQSFQPYFLKENFHEQESREKLKKSMFNSLSSYLCECYNELNIFTHCRHLTQSVLHEEPELMQLTPTTPGMSYDSDHLTAYTKCTAQKDRESKNDHVWHAAEEEKRSHYGDQTE